jgi:hypothetical protein
MEEETPEQEIVDELEDEVDFLEDEFDSVKSDDVASTTREKQEKVEDILEEVHEQIDFLKQVSEEKMNGERNR